MRSHEDSAFAALLLEREAKGLQVPVVVRILFCLYGAAHYIWLSRTLALPPLGAALIGAALVAGLSANGYFLLLLRRRRCVGPVGIAGATLDVGLLAMECFAFEAIRVDLSIPAGSVFDTPIPLVMLSFVAINGLALRPRYPAIVLGGALLLQAGLIARALGDPTTRFVAGPFASDGGISTTLVTNTPVLTAMIGLVICGTTAAARQTVRSAIAAQLARARLERAQAEIVMHEKVETLARLVAGISHELNTPLGALESSAATQLSALERLDQALPEPQAKGPCEN